MQKKEKAEKKNQRKINIPTENVAKYYHLNSKILFSYGVQTANDIKLFVLN